MQVVFKTYCYTVTAQQEPTTGSSLEAAHHIFTTYFLTPTLISNLISLLNSLHIKTETRNTITKCVEAVLLTTEQHTMHNSP
jgi:hypothetical protein